MKNILSVIVLASFLFTSCKKEEIAEALPTEEVTTEVTTDSVITAPPQNQPLPNGASVMTSSPQATTQSYNTPAPVATAKGMNPAHGQPGHRCDISVGAPLNSPPGKKTTTPGSATVTQATTVTPQMMQTVDAPITTTPTTPVVTAPGMNPPHGQPDHVCSVAVGAPLPKQ